MTRFYHSFTTRYNVYFNGIENYKEQLKEMEEGYEDNFTDLLLMHPTQAYANPKDPVPSEVSIGLSRNARKPYSCIPLRKGRKEILKNERSQIPGVYETGRIRPVLFTTHGGLWEKHNTTKAISSEPLRPSFIYPAISLGCPIW